MKKQSIKALALIAISSAFVTSCDLLKDLNYKVTQSPLEMHADSVRVKVEVMFPEKGIKKKASAEITPMLGTTALKTVTVQGEKVSGNGTVIQYKPGGKMVYTDVVAYKPEFENAELIVTGKVFKGGKEKKDKFTDTKIADGTIITPYLVAKNFKVIYEKDAFVRTNEKSYVAQINFEKGKSVVKPSELKDKDMIDFVNWMKSAETNPKIAIKAINITGFASPEGEVGKNDNLSMDRATAAKTASVSLAKKVGSTAGQLEIYNLVGKGEDFDGFKKELQASSINEDEKNLVIRVLEMHKDPTMRETEMRNMGKTFTELDKDIFPKLRRSEISTVYDLTGYSDEELKAVSISNPETLTIEELLFAATLTNDLNEKARLYTIATKNYANDHRGFNNLGVVNFYQNKVADALANFEKANNLKDNAIAKNNLAAIAGLNGDRAKAAKLLAQAKGAGSEVNYNNGIINIQAGKYADAVTNFGAEASFNKALAQLLNNSSAEAMKTVDLSLDKESARGFYLKAIAAARMDKSEAVMSNLKNAISKDASFKTKAGKDREFLKFATDATFMSIAK
jgi:tetratricopeptide (TPR) repeat protein/outer membrane protein OmpA-like peptidoglycan-associated protein